MEGLEEVAAGLDLLALLEVTQLLGKVIMVELLSKAMYILLLAAVAAQEVLVETLP